MIIIREKKKPMIESLYWRNVYYQDLQKMLPKNVNMNGNLFLTFPSCSHVEWPIDGIVDKGNRLLFTSRTMSDFNLYYDDIKTTKVGQSSNGDIKGIQFTLKGEVSLSIAW